MNLCRLNSWVHLLICVPCRRLSGRRHGAVWTEACNTGAVMLTLASKLKKDDGGKTGRASGASDSAHRVSIRDRLLTKGTGALFSSPLFLSGPLCSSCCPHNPIPEQLEDDGSMEVKNHKHKLLSFSNLPNFIWNTFNLISRVTVNQNILYKEAL